MKSRIPPNSRQKAEMKKLAQSEVDKYLKEQTNAIVEKNLKLMCVCLNRTYKFGKKRLSRLIKDIGELSCEHDSDEIFWEHIEKRLSQMGMIF